MTFSKAFHVESEDGLAIVARALAPMLPPKAILSLEGDLGAGKTALARALIRHMAQNAELEVPSPTFTLLQTYDSPSGPIWHFDMYRLKSADEAYEIGWEEALSEARLIILEWASRIQPLLPENLITVNIAPQADGSRDITVSA